MSEITPALTREEWAEELYKLDADVLHGIPKWRSLQQVGQRRGPHAAAALYLSDEPFGFTREDVERLRAMAVECTELMEAEALPPDPHSRRVWWRDMGDALDSLASRIAALLPPE